MARHEDLAAELQFRPCLATDPIGMEFLGDLGDPALTRQLAGVRLQTLANVYRAIAEGAAQAAKIVATER